MRGSGDDWITRVIDNPTDRPPCPECHTNARVGPVWKGIFKCQNCGTVFEAYKPNDRRIRWVV